MDPKRRAKKEVATSAAEGPSPPPIVERPIDGRELSLSIRDCRLSFKADVWLSLDEPKKMINYDLMLLGNLVL